ncbi:Major Facilitator Superfamily protein [Falsiruegeria litorea R37]|uniref:Major Facilitator Superfamily protein n=1 Tax=Falsiruegeria litorea R37 TaxID=1200284 RepID=A0A1Y5TQ11_9RHOB|nr:MFS transporter [Falsiruegeria litorea]SLN69304.1 Major Facilitator Superfamily protein [Falsiruegeria litorea R37]
MKLQSALEFLTQNARWLTAGGVLTFLSSFGQTFFISVFAGEIRETFDLSHGEWGGLYSLGTMVSAVVMVWAGAATDFFRVRLLGPLILAGLVVACLVMGLNTWVWALPISVFLLRFFGQGMSSHMAMVAMARWFTATRGRALSIATLGFAVGEALLPLAFVTAMLSVHWQTLWILSAGICAMGIPVLILLLRHERTPQSLAKSNASTGMEGRHWTRAEALRHPLFWTLMPAILGPSAFVTALFFHQVHLAEIKGWSHIQLVSLFPVYTAAGIVAMLTTGWALDRFGTARLMPFYMLPFVVGFLSFALGNSLPLALIGFVFLGLTSGAIATLIPAFWADFYGTAHIGAIKALATAVMVLGSAIGPAITGALIDVGIGFETQLIGVVVYFIMVSALTTWGVRRAAQTL